MIRLYVQYTEKDKVKKYGARWNPVEKFWYYDGDELPAELEPWSRPAFLPADGASRKSVRTAAVSSVQPVREQRMSAAESNDFDELMQVINGQRTSAAESSDFEELMQLINGQNVSSATEEEFGASTMMAAKQMAFGAADGIPGQAVRPIHEQMALRKTQASAFAMDLRWLESYMTVSEAGEMIKCEYRNSPRLRHIMVQGEVTNFTAPNRGNYYFDIKDDKALLSCLMWGNVADALLSFPFKAGVQVAITGYLDLYPPNGKTSLIVRDIKDAGQGEAALALLRLQARLEEEGLFDEKYKKPIPKYPSAVGIVTSKDGKAIGDICKTAAERNPYVQLILYHVNVQGKYAAESIVEGIRALDQMGVDTIIVGRGGGSDEELMAYNQEIVVRAVFTARTPIISAVGHEGNWTLTDYAADFRESTPTKAAVRAFPDVMADQRRLAQLVQSLVFQMRSQLNQRKLLLDARKNRLEALDPRRILKEKQDLLQNLSTQLQQKMQSAFEARKHRCEVLITQLHGLSPTAKLVKGFGYISLDEKPVTTISQVHTGDEIRIRIHDGQIRAEVTETESQE